MHILVIQETDWLTRGPHTQHHIFERLSTNPHIKVTALDYDIDHVMKEKSLCIKKKTYKNVNKAIENSNVKVIRTAHIQVKYLRRISSLISNFLTILKIIRKERPDLIVGFSISNGLIGMLFSKLFNIPYLFFYIDILHELVPIEMVRNVSKTLSIVLFKLSDKILVHTNHQKQFILSAGINSKKIGMLPDGISLNNIHVSKAKLNSLKESFSIKEKDFVIFFMGYLYEFAGLIEIVEYYSKKGLAEELNLKFLILGDGGVYNRLVKLKEKLRADWVILPGRVPYSEITEYVELADLCLMSFDINNVTKDIMPIKIFEYMAQKKPILSNSLPSVVYELKDKSDIIFAKNQTDLIEKITPLSKKKKELQEIGQKGFELVKKEYTWKKLLKDFKIMSLKMLKKTKK
jgi:glycosyltransferase involved in cell wall biosynthesis